MAAGIPPWRLWALTPSELTLAIRGVTICRRAERDLMLTAAWTTAALMRKKGRLPTLRSILRTPPRKLRRLTEAEREAKKAAILAQFPDAAPVPATNGAGRG